MYHLLINREKLNIAKILKSGQVFRYEVIDGKGYILIHKLNYVFVEENKHGYVFHCSEEEFINIWYIYLDLERDYVRINQIIIDKDKRLTKVIDEFEGMRILKQDQFEMLITFIISQSKSIPQIRKLVNNLAVCYGEEIGYVYGEKIYSFPTAQHLQQLTEDDYRTMKFGYRAAYLYEAVKWSINLNKDMNSLSDIDLKQQLVSIKGVGNKVVACVMLFGYGRHNTFPIDVWMKRIMLQLYESEIRKELKNPEVKNIRDSQIESYGLKLYGETAGIAQQYLFEYGRNI